MYNFRGSRFFVIIPNLPIKPLVLTSVFFPVYGFLTRYSRITFIEDPAGSFRNWNFGILGIQYRPLRLCVDLFLLLRLYEVIALR